MSKRLLFAKFCVILTLSLLGGTPPLFAQVTPGTAGAAIIGAKTVLDKLQDVVTKLTGNAQIAAGQVAGQLSDVIGETEKLTRNNFATPIQNLSADARASVERLNQTVQLLDSVVGRNQACIFQNLDLFIADLETAAANAKDGVIFADPGAPRLVSFQFDSVGTANSVPKLGGSVKIKGFRLWREKDMPPEIRLVTADRTEIARQPATPGPSVDEIYATVDSTVIHDRAGQCLRVNVTTFRKKKFLFIKYGKETEAELSLPMCIPSEYRRSLSLKATLAYSVTTLIERPLSGSRFEFRNRDCGNSNNVSHSENWGAAIPNGFRIVRVLESDKDIVNSTNVSVSFTGDTVTAAGWLDSSSCINTPFSHTLLHDTHWIETLTPIVAGPDTHEYQSSGMSDKVPMNVPGTTICVDVPRDAASSGASTVWITLDAYIGGDKVAIPFFVSPKYTALTPSPAVNLETINGYGVTTRYTPAVVGGRSQVCADVRSLTSCNW